MPSITETKLDSIVFLLFVCITFDVLVVAPPAIAVVLVAIGGVASFSLASTIPTDTLCKSSLSLDMTEFGIEESRNCIVRLFFDFVDCTLLWFCILTSFSNFTSEMSLDITISISLSGYLFTRIMIAKLYT